MAGPAQAEARKVRCPQVLSLDSITPGTSGAGDLQAAGDSIELWKNQSMQPSASCMATFCRAISKSASVEGIGGAAVRPSGAERRKTGQRECRRKTTPLTGSVDHGGPRRHGTHHHTVHAQQQPHISRLRSGMLSGGSCPRNPPPRRRTGCCPFCSGQCAGTNVPQN